MYGLLQANEKSVVKLMPVCCSNITIGDDGVITLTKETDIETYQYKLHSPSAEVLFIGSEPKDVPVDSYIEKDEDGCRLMIGGVECNDLIFEDADLLFDQTYRYKQPLGLWGIFRIRENRKVEIVREPKYTKISVFRKNLKQVKLEKDGKRPTILTLK